MGFDLLLVPKWEKCVDFGKSLRMTTKKNCEKPQKGWGGRLLEAAGEGRLGRGAESEPANQFEVDQAGGQALRDGIGGVGKVFDQHI
jgi:hypothetical protein